VKLIQRIGYYLGGFSIGLIILTFFLTGKKVSCSYGPEARVLKNINSKTVIYSDLVLAIIVERRLDSANINEILRKGYVNFSESQTRKEPCATYHIEGTLNNNNVALVIENCDSIASIKNIKWID